MGYSSLFNSASGVSSIAPGNVFIAVSRRFSQTLRLLAKIGLRHLLFFNSVSGLAFPIFSFLPRTLGPASGDGARLPSFTNELAGPFDRETCEIRLLSQATLNEL